MMGIERRKFLTFSLAGCAALGAPRLAWARPAAGQRRLVFILQRGAADGLGTIAPFGDSDFERLRGALAEDYSTAQRLDSMFALHPAMERSAQFFDKGEMLAVHAVASVYRARSHFDGQNLLEIGADRPYARSDGWMNRLLGMLPGGANGMAISPVVPPALQGPHQALSYAPSRLPDPGPDFLDRIDTLYQSDERLHALWQETMRTRSIVDGVESSGTGKAMEIGSLTAQLLNAEDGARVAMIETGGWDTHSGQRQRLARELGNLDNLIGALRDGLGNDWADTLVIVATEFGRTAAINGTQGTDHGTASAALLFGGSVHGGRVDTDWPGLRSSDLYEGRDLMPTASLEGIIASATAGHFSLDPDLAAHTLFSQVKAYRPGALVG